MSAFSGTIQLALFAVLGFSLLAALLSALASPMLRAYLLRRSPELRAKVLSLWAASPALSGLSLTALCFLPSLLGDDHCATHDDVHAHFCLLHPMSSLGISGGWLLLSLVALALLSFFLWKIIALARFAQTLSSLRRLSHYDAQHGVYIVDSSSYLALSGGLGRASIYLSSALIKALPNSILRIVVAHENIHLRRGDGLRLLLASWLSFLHLPSVRRRLLAELSLACEQACDEETSRTIGDRLQIAETIIAVERLFQNQTTQYPIFCSFIGGDVSARVEALLREPLPQKKSPRILYVAALSSLFILAEPLHHFAETFWHLILG